MLKRDEDEPPFHHGGLGILELIDRDIDRRKSGEHEPCDQEIVMRLSDYDNWLPCVGGRRSTEVAEPTSSEFSRP